jgi:hypothetical protein
MQSRARACLPAAGVASGRILFAPGQTGGGRAGIGGWSAEGGGEFGDRDGYRTGTTESTGKIYDGGSGSRPDRTRRRRAIRGGGGVPRRASWRPPACDLPEIVRRGGGGVRRCERGGAGAARWSRRRGGGGGVAACGAVRSPRAAALRRGGVRQTK